MNPISVTILRDGRESPRKCTVAALRGLPNITIKNWRRDHAVDAGGLLLLHPAGPPLQSGDAAWPLLLVDSSWHHLAQILRDVKGDPVRRSIPTGFVTAYPRRSNLYRDPEGGLATVEALHAALAVLGHRRDDILEPYYFRDQFLALNANMLALLTAGSLHAPGAAPCP